MATNPVLRIGTRGSDLALWQAHFLQGELKRLGVASELEVIRTKGDRIQHLSFDKLEGKGFFTEELEQGLLDGTIQVAVHSMKDLPTNHPAGLAIAGVSERADPTDWLLVRKSAVDPARPWSLAQNSKVGTSSARRKAMLANLRPDAEVDDVRGNVPTRVDKLRRGDYDAIVLAAAGLTRLELDLGDLHVAHLHPREFVPAPAQGVLAYQCRESDTDTRRILARIHHRETASCTNVERRLLNAFDGGCHLPLGAYCQRTPHGYELNAAYAPALGEPLVRHRISYSTFDGLAEAMHKRLLGGVAA